MRFKGNITIFVFLVIILIIMNCSMITALSDEEEVMSALEEYYDASSKGDVERYLAIQDPLFIKQMEEDAGFSAREFYEYTFSQVKTENVEISNAQIFIEDDSAIVYYRLSGNYEISDGDSGRINNDMVAFLWKYDSWKVRWTITRSLYNDKISMSYAMDAAIESSFEDVREDSVKEQMIAEGLDVGSLENYELEDAKRSYWYVYILIIILIGFLFYKFKNHQSVDSAKKKVKESYKKVSPKIKKAVDEGKKRSVSFYNNMQPKVKNAMGHTKKISVRAYKKIEKKTKEAYHKTSPKVKEISNKVKSSVKKKIEENNKKKNH